MQSRQSLPAHIAGRSRYVGLTDKYKITKHGRLFELTPIILSTENSVPHPIKLKAVAAIVFALIIMLAYIGLLVLLLFGIRTLLCGAIYGIT